MFHVKQTDYFLAPLAKDIGLRIECSSTAREYASPWQHISVEATHRFGRLYHLDGHAMAAEADEFIIHESLAHIVALAHPAPVSTLILGGGDGASARELLKHPSITRIVVAELDPDVVRVVSAEIPALPAGAFDNPRVALHIGDAAETLRTLHARGERFDLILFDLTEPDDPACAHLHGDAFLRLCAASLTPNGLIHTQLGSPFYQPDKVRALMLRLRSVFPAVGFSLINVPLYGGPWLLAHASLADLPMPDEACLNARLAVRGIEALRYYNPALHLASSALPNYVRDLLA